MHARPKNIMSKVSDEKEKIDQIIKEVKDEKEREKIKKELETTDEKINKMVYELYGLSEEEIRVVEGGY